jgi:RNA polymerase sigma-70 factor, ECF subfamily
MSVIDDAVLAAWSVRAAAQGRAAWPELEVTPAELERLARMRLAEEGSSQPPAALDELDAAELTLACACVRGERAALAGLRRRYFDPLTPTLARMGLGDSQRDDVWQVLCQRLVLGGADEPAKIARYAGTGNLGGLVRVAATRLGLNWLEQEKRFAGGDPLLEQIANASHGAEVGLMKAQHASQLREEVGAAIAGLSSRERMVLRLHLVEGVGIDAIAKSCDVHRATAARWVASAKERLAASVRQRLAARWGVGDASMPALRTLVDSQLDLSLGRLLAAD